MNYPYLLGATEESFKSCAMMNKHLFKDDESYDKFEEYIKEQLILVKELESKYSKKHP